MARDTIEEPVDLPELGPSDTRDQLRAAAIEEGVAAGEAGHQIEGEESQQDFSPEQEEEIFTEVAQAEEITVDELRKLPGSEDYSDEELLAEWKKAEKEAADEKAAFKWPFYDEKGNKVEDFSKITLSDLFTGKYQLGYNALGKEQKKAIADIIRTAQNGHFNEQKYSTTVQERNQVMQEVSKLREQVGGFDQQQRTWLAALNAFAQGNIEPMKVLAQKLIEESNKQPLNIPGMVSEDKVRADQQLYEQGVQFVNTYVAPKVMDIAQRYGANVAESMRWVEWALRNEGNFLTREKVDMIIDYELPQAIEAAGMQAGSRAGGAMQAAPQSNAELEALKNQIAELQKTIAQTANSRTQEIRGRQKRTPPAGGGSVSGAGDSMPALNNREQMKEWLRS